MHAVALGVCIQTPRREYTAVGGCSVLKGGPGIGIIKRAIMRSPPSALLRPAPSHITDTCAASQQQTEGASRR